MAGPLAQFALVLAGRVARAAAAAAATPPAPAAGVPLLAPPAPPPRVSPPAPLALQEVVELRQALDGQAAGKGAVAAGPGALWDLGGQGEGGGQGVREGGQGEGGGHPTESHMGGHVSKHTLWSTSLGLLTGLRDPS